MASDDTWASDARPYLGARQPGEPDAWAAHAAAHGRKGTQQLLSVEEVDPPEHVRRFLRIEAGETAVVRRRLILLDGQPVELADSYYPLRIAGGTPLAKQRRIPGGAVTLLAELGFSPESEPLEEVAAAIATPEQAAALGLTEGTAVLVLTRFTASSAGVPTEVSIMVMTRNLQYRQRKQAG